jgi:hypothetical protein
VKAHVYVGKPMDTSSGVVTRGWRPRDTGETCADCGAAPGFPCRVAYGGRVPDPLLVLSWGHRQRTEGMW